MKTLLQSMVFLTSMLLLNPLFASTAGVVVSGIGGTVEYENEFEENGQSIVEGLKTLSQDESAFTFLSGPEVTRQTVLDAITLQAGKQARTFILVLVGHGSVDGRHWRFNIPGKDISDEDLVAALADVDSPDQLLVVATSASGALLDIMSQPGRAVVTATKSAGELNASRFGGFFAQAMGSDIADVDRNEILTIGEAWRYANEQVAQYYAEQKLLASEHPRIKTNGQTDIAVARLGALRLAINNPAVASLLDERLDLEKQFNALRLKKADLSYDDYYAQLETILLSIATLQQQIDVQTGWKPVNE